MLPRLEAEGFLQWGVQGGLMLCRYAICGCGTTTATINAQVCCYAVLTPPVQWRYRSGHNFRQRRASVDISSLNPCAGAANAAPSPRPRSSPLPATRSSLACSP
eukprot:3896409-Rhodomonas_salina.2